MTAPSPTHWHAQTVEDSLQRLDSGPTGLDTAEAERRLASFGPNRLPERAGPGPLKRFLLQFHNLLIYVLLASTLVTLALGEWLDSAVIFGVVLINAVVGFIQEGKAESAMRAIQKLLTLDSRVKRNGEVRQVPAEDLVPGDLVLLEAGDRAQVLSLIRSAASGMTGLKAVELRGPKGAGGEERLAELFASPTPGSSGKAVLYLEGAIHV